MIRTGLALVVTVTLAPACRPNVPEHPLEEPKIEVQTTDVIAPPRGSGSPSIAPPVASAIAAPSAAPAASEPEDDPELPPPGHPGP